jgi:hypothetical protein
VIIFKKVYKTLALLFLGLFYLGATVIAVQDSLELHSGTVKLIRDGKSQIINNAGETFALQANDRLQTGKKTKITLYLKNRDNTVKLFSNSFFKLDDLAAEENSVALLTGKGNFNVKPLPKTSNTENAEAENSKKGKKLNKFGVKLGAKLAKLKKSKLRGKKKRFNIRTVSAILGVRGTEFVVATGGDTTNLLALSGEVTLASPEIPDYEIPVLANEVSNVREGSGPSIPVAVSPEERDKIAKADGKDSFQEVQFGESESISSIQSRMKSDDETPNYEEEENKEGDLLEQMDRLDELENILDNAENAIDAAKSRLFILSMTFTNRD